jgi:RIO kinase 1
VVHASLPSREAEQAYLDEMRARAESRAAADRATQAQQAQQQRLDRDVEHRVFMQAYIPQSLHAVRDAEAETARVARGDTAGQLYYRALHGLGGGGAESGGEGVAGGSTGAAAAPVAAAASAANAGAEAGADEAGEEGESSGDGDEEDEADSDGEERDPNRPPPQDKGRAGMTREEQRLHKLAVKLAKREKRKTKIKKHVKKSHTKN